MDFKLRNWSNNVRVYEEITDINLSTLCLESKTLIEIRNSGNPIHLLVGGGFKQNSGFLVGLGGAISNRDKNMKPPYFSFLNVAAQIKSAYLLISDSTLYESDDLKLGWYTGHENDVGFQRNVAAIIDMFAVFYNSQPTLTGGSGGGFAALVSSIYLKVNHNVFVWNPQTNIAKYVKSFVDEYLNVAFPKYAAEDFHKTFSLIKREGILTDVTSTPFNVKSRILYFQNHSDWHNEIHTKPFIENHCGFINSKNALYQQYDYKDNVSVLIANWGHGHLPPPKEIISYVLLKLLDGQEITKVLDKVVDVFSEDITDTKKGLNMFDVKITIEEGKVLGEIIVDSFFFEKNKYDYAFYLFHNNERVDVIWYKNNMKVEFDLKEMTGDFYISAFIRDISHGNVRAFKSKKITINSSGQK